MDASDTEKGVLVADPNPTSYLGRATKITQQIEAPAQGLAKTSPAAGVLHAVEMGVIAQESKRVGSGPEPSDIESREQRLDRFCRVGIEHRVVPTMELQSAGFDEAVDETPPRSGTRDDADALVRCLLEDVPGKVDRIPCLGIHVAERHSTSE